MGVGAGNFGRHYDELRRFAKHSQYTHDIWLRAMSETGIIGFALLLAVLGALALGLVRAAQELDGLGRASRRGCHHGGGVLARTRVARLGRRVPGARRARVCIHDGGDRAAPLEPRESRPYRESVESRGADRRSPRRVGRPRRRGSRIDWAVPVKPVHCACARDLKQRPARRSTTCAARTASIRSAPIR